MNLTILTPKTPKMERTVSKVFLPGTAGSFEVLKGHAPLISSLTGGSVRWENESDGSRESFEISSGFVEVNDNVITVTAEQ
ncbi:MAG: F0F1 ATP synthase subunit epsilon [Bacteroidales bacterium]|nr:F0F1 ATP synthase subunit epsilon [Candidatus Cacconaster equifaecalis]